jgi:hypothetical protein
MSGWRREQVVCIGPLPKTQHFFFEIREQFVMALAVGNFVGSFWRSQPSVMHWFVTDMSVSKLLTDLPSNFNICLIL